MHLKCLDFFFFSAIIVFRQTYSAEPLYSLNFKCFDYLGLAKLLPLHFGAKCNRIGSLAGICSP